MIQRLLDWTERGWVPDWMVRTGIRRLLQQRLNALDAAGDAGSNPDEAFTNGPIAVETDAANQQHYALPPEFFAEVLGPRLKYSACLWNSGTRELAAAEADMLKLSCESAELADGQRILELGCGWGSLSLWMAEHYPRARIVAMSNSDAQRTWIEAECRRRGIENLQVRTADINRFDPAERFDRIVSVEMFEHLRNYDALFDRLRLWLEPGGKLFVHVFAHRRHAYLFDTAADDDWMGRYFFTGGTMPSHHLLPRLARGFELEQDWQIDGRHYQLTLEAWLDRMDSRKDTVLALFRGTYGAADAERWFQRWRMFFMACAELFGYRRGGEWGVSHYRFARR
ncbi:MAG: cyclopropane-fatty-acyl-phospholipid synthase family protein [Methylotetracoccus sp.]